MRANPYYDPDKFDLETIGEIDWSSGSYEFDLTVVWRRKFDGRFVTADDAGCSCPVPFEGTGCEDLRLIGSLAEFQRELGLRGAENSDGHRTVEIAGLVERMHAAGAR